MQSLGHVCEFENDYCMRPEGQWCGLSQVTNELPFFSFTCFYALLLQDNSDMTNTIQHNLYKKGRLKKKENLGCSIVLFTIPIIRPVNREENCQLI